MKIRSIIKGKELNNAPLENDAAESADVLQEDAALSTEGEKTQKKHKKGAKASSVHAKGKNKVFYAVSIL